MPKHIYGHCLYGVDYSIPPHELQRTALADAQNVVPNDSGLPQSRRGSVAKNNVSLSNRITSFFEYRSGTTRHQLCSYSTKIAKFNTATRQFDDIITGLTSDKMMQWVNFQGKAIGVNEGSDVPQYYDGTTGGDLTGSPPTGKAIVSWSNRIWFIGDASNLANLTGCALNDPTDYASSGASGYISQTIGDANDPLIGGIGYYDLLLVGKKNNIWKVSGDPPTDASSLEIRPLFSQNEDNVGFTSPWAITQVGKDIIFLDGYDIKSLFTVQEYGDVRTTSIIPHFRDFLQETVDKDYLQYAQFFNYKKRNQVWVTIPTGAASHLVFVLDYKFLKETGRYAFYPMSGLTINCFGGEEDGEITNLFYGDEDGRVFQLDTGYNDSGAAIDAHITTMVSGNEIENQVTDRHEYRKQFQYSETFIKPDNTNLTMTPYYAIDLFDYSSVRDASNYTALSDETVSSWSGTGVKRKRVRLWGLGGKTLALKWRVNTLANAFTFYPSMVDYEWKTKTNIV